MPGLGVEINADALDDMATAVGVLGTEMQGEQLRLVMGTAVREVVHDHFIDLNLDTAHHQSAESLGAARTGFYLEAADRTQAPQVVSDGVVISIDQEGLAQRFFGGDIEAKPGSFLTIPARAEAYGKRAGEFGNLKLIRFPSGLFALIDKDEPAHEGGVYYWLVRSVHQQEDPSVLPTSEEMLTAAETSGQNYIERVWEREIAA